MGDRDIGKLLDEVVALAGSGVRPVGKAAKSALDFGGTGLKAVNDGIGSICPRRMTLPDALFCLEPFGAQVPVGNDATGRPAAASARRQKEQG